jgi:hypothetical protein
MTVATASWLTARRPDGNVVLFVHDTAFEHLRPLHVTFKQFWDCSFKR